jgi:hypothetical protein
MSGRFMIQKLGFIPAQCSPRMEQPRFRCGDRDPEYLGGLIYREFLQLIKFADLPKARTHLCDRISDGISLEQCASLAEALR